MDIEVAYKRHQFKVHQVEKLNVLDHIHVTEQHLLWERQHHLLLVLIAMPYRAVGTLD